MTLEERIAHLEFIINEIDGALCNYCNTVRDADHPFHPLEATAQKRTFSDLCDAYNLWHERHDEIGEITMQFFLKHERLEMVLRQIASGRHMTIERVVKVAREAVADIPPGDGAPYNDSSLPEHHRSR